MRRLCGNVQTGGAALYYAWRALTLRSRVSRRDWRGHTQSHGCGNSPVSS